MIWFKALTEPQEWHFIKVLANVIACEDSQGVVAYDDNGIAAVCVADCFTAENCQVHVAIRNPMVIRRGFLHEVFRHLFVTCKRVAVFGGVPSDNAKALKWDAHIGFKEVRRIPDFYARGVDCIVFRMDREDCRWLVTDAAPAQQMEAA